MNKTPDSLKDWLQSLMFALGGEGDSRPLQLEVGEYYDRVMRERSDNGTLDYLSDEQGEKELSEGWRQ